MCARARSRPEITSVGPSVVQNETYCHTHTYGVPVNYLYKFYPYFSCQDIRFFIVIYQLATLYSEWNILVMRHASADPLKDVHIGDHGVISVQHDVKDLERRMAS